MLLASVLHGCGGVGIAGSKPTQSEVLALKDSYRFENPMAPVPAAYPLPEENPGVPVAEAPDDFTIARAVPIVSPAPTGKVILALVHSNKPYKYLGIEAGDNYVWRNERSFFKFLWKTYMVPASRGADPKRMKRSKERYSEGDHTQPRLVVSMDRLLGVVAFGACLDDPRCGSGHCGYGNVD